MRKGNGGDVRKGKLRSSRSLRIISPLVDCKGSNLECSAGTSVVVASWQQGENIHSPSFVQLILFGILWTVKCKISKLYIDICDTGSSAV